MALCCGRETIQLIVNFQVEMWRDVLAALHLHWRRFLFFILKQKAAVCGIYLLKLNLLLWQILIDLKSTLT